MSADGTVPVVYIVKIAGVSCSHIDLFDVILEKAAKFYSSFLQQRSYLACRDDLGPSDRTWAVLCFRNQQDAVKCAQWLFSEPFLSSDGGPSGRVQVLNRLQASSKDLENATAEAKIHAQNVLKWKLANKSRPTHPHSPTLQPGTSVFQPGTSVFHSARSNKATSPCATATGVTSKQVDPFPHPPALKRQKPLASAFNKVVVAPETRREVVAPFIDEKKVSKSKQMIAEVLSKSMDAPTAQSSKPMRSELANSIVEAILALNIDTHQFSEKTRHLQFNLGKNTDLRTSVLEGIIAPEVLVKLRSEQMETKDQAEIRKKIQEKSLETHVLPHGDVVFGRNIDAALQLKREAPGYKEPGYSDADELNNSSRANNTSTKSALLPVDVVDVSLDDAYPSAQKRLRDELDGNSNDDLESDHDVEERSLINERVKKSVKFDPFISGLEKKIEKPVAQPTTSVENGIAKHHSSLLKGTAKTLSHLPRQQIDWGPPIENDDRGTWSPPQILGNKSKIYKGQLSWTNAAGKFKAEVEVVGFQPAAFIRLPSSLDIVESISVDGMLHKIQGSGAKPWNLHRAWIIGPNLPKLFGRAYLQSLVPDTLESPTKPFMKSSDISTGHPTGKLMETLNTGTVTSPKNPDVSSFERHNKVRSEAYDEEALIGEAIDQAYKGIQSLKTVGRILVNLNGEILQNYNEGWAKGSHVGWELFIMEPTIAACELASVLVQEGDAARRSHALLMIAIPHYWGELLPLGKNGVRQGTVDSGRIYISASGASTLHNLPKVINCEFKAHSSRLNLGDIWDSVFEQQNIRLYPRQPTNIPLNLVLGNQRPEDPKLEENEENRKNVVAFDALKKGLQESADGVDALICQDDVPHYLDLAVAAPSSSTHSSQKNFLLLGCWNRKIVLGLGHHAIDFRDPRSWI